VDNLARFVFSSKGDFRGGGEVREGDPGALGIWGGRKLCPDGRLIGQRGENEANRYENTRGVKAEANSRKSLRVGYVTRGRVIKGCVKVGRDRRGGGGSTIPCG